MSAPTAVELDILCIVLIVLFHVFYVFRWTWNYPLQHGPGFFLGVGVSPGFYEGPGIRWLQSYRAIVVALYIVFALALGAIIIWGRWDLTPLWAGGSAPVFVVAFMGFVMWTRRKLGANPPVLPGVAAPLEPRRLGDYISWPMEALVGGLLGAGWWLLLVHGDAHVEWQGPVLSTWAALGLLPGKIVLVRNSFPLPPERTEEHYRLSDAWRRYSLRWMDVLRWFFVVNVAAYALIHGWVAAQIAWFRWTLVIVQLVPMVVLVVVIVQGQQRLAAMGRELRPAGSWSTPFRPARLMLPGGLTWFAIWFGGLMLLLILFHG